jgi:hypothetical protein
MAMPASGVLVAFGVLVVLGLSLPAALSWSGAAVATSRSRTTPAESLALDALPLDKDIPKTTTTARKTEAVIDNRICRLRRRCARVRGLLSLMGVEVPSVRTFNRIRRDVRIGPVALVSPTSKDNNARRIICRHVGVSDKHFHLLRTRSVSRCGDLRVNPGQGIAESAIGHSSFPKPHAH